jgi:hypothetical protein
MSRIRDQVRKDIQEEFIELMEIETLITNDVINDLESLQNLCKETANVDDLQTLQSKCSLPIIKKKIKFL